MHYYADSLRAQIADNRRLNEYKLKLKDYYKEADLSSDSENPALIIYDGSFIMSSSTAKQAILFYNIATPVLFIAAAAVGFFAGFLYTKSRKGEFAVMRSIGVNSFYVVMEVCVEQLVIGALSAELAVMLHRIVWDQTVKLNEPVLLFAGYFIGTILPVIKAASESGMSVVRAKE